MPLIMKKTVNGQPTKIRLTDGTLYADLPIGFIIPSFETEAPLGFLKLTDTLANRTVSRTTYKELFDWATERDLIGTGKPFGVGDGSTTFVIPDGKEIAFKGVGEYEGTVGAHVKSGGLANGEFLDDRLQNHTHTLARATNFVGGGQGTAVVNVTEGTENGESSGIHTGYRSGATTEVKSLGCHYYIKAKNVGVPSDFISAVQEYFAVEEVSGTTDEGNGTYTIRRTGNVVTLDISGCTIEQGGNHQLCTIPQKFRPRQKLLLTGFSGAGSVDNANMQGYTINNLSGVVLVYTYTALSTSNPQLHATWII